MNSNRTRLIQGFLLLNCIHWGAVVLTSLLNNLFGIFVIYHNIPWFRLVIVLGEILLAFKLLNNTAASKLISQKSLLKLTALSIALFLGAQFNFVYDVNGWFCGLSLLDGSAPEIISFHDDNQKTVRIIESLMLSIAIVVYVLKHSKKEYI